MTKLSEVADNIELRDDGLWVAKTLSPVSFPEEGNRHCFAVEDASFWFQHRNNCIREVLRRFPPSGTFFDIGGGNGYVAKALEEAGVDVVLIEPGVDGVRNAQKRGLRQIIWGAIEDAGLRPGTVPAIGIFDVLEHVEDDRAFLDILSRLQPTDGRLYLTVPAFQALWSHEDKIAGHWRRYILQDLDRKLGTSGYSVEFATYFFCFLVVPTWLLRVVPYRLGLGREIETEEHVRADHEIHNPVVKYILTRLMGRELSRITASRPISAGTSCLVAARKRS